MRVLIVEDEVLIAMHLEQLVVEFGHEVCALVISEAEAVAHAATRPPLLNQIGKLAGAPKNDGLVSPDSALLKGALRVVEADVDHGMPVLGTDNNALDPVRCLAALLSVCFEVS